MSYLHPPPCESWVIVSCAHITRFGKRKGINLHWESYWEPFDFTERYKKTRLNGIRTAATLAKIIKYYKPKSWFIENPRSSKLFKWLDEHMDFRGYMNYCTYGAYGYTSNKPTIICSNVKLELRNERVIGLMPLMNDHFGRGSRSDVPEVLYREIMGCAAGSVHPID